MFGNFNPFNSESKDIMTIEIKGEMDKDGAKEVAEITAQGKKWFWIFIGVGIGFAITCFGISLIKWW